MKKTKLKQNATRGDETPKRNADDKIWRLVDAIRGANRGDKSELERVQKFVKGSPEKTVEILDGDLSKQAELKLVDAVAGKQLAFREGLLAKLEVLRTELGASTANPIERLLIERVVACWLQISSADTSSAQAQAQGVSLKQGEYLERRQNQAHRRYLSAIKMLAVVRRLALPIRVDVNVAGTVETKSAESPTMTARRRWSPEYVDN